MRHLDHVSIGVVVTDERLFIEFWNSCMEDWTGIPRRQALGKELQELFPHFGEKTYQARLKLLLEGGAPVIFSYQLHGCLFPPRSTNAEPRVQHVTVTLDRDAAGSPLLFFSVEDRTEVSMRVRAAREALREKEFLMRELNHRVKNNLNMILSFIELQRMKADSEELIHGLNDLDGRIRSFAALHEAMYRGKDAQWIGADEYLRTVTADLLSSMVTPGCRLDFRFQVEPVELNPKAALYTGLIAVEALTNAIKYGLGKRSEGRLLLSVKKQEGSVLELLVEDDGPGFDPAYDVRTGDSLGTRIISILAAELKGSVNFSNAGSLGGAQVAVRFSTDIGPS